MKNIRTIMTVFLASLYFVVSGQIFVKHDAQGISDGSSWLNAYTDLQDALDSAVPGGQIWIASGDYLPTGSPGENMGFVANVYVELYGGFSGIESELIERDWQANPTVISGDKLDDDVEGEFFDHRDDNIQHLLILDHDTGVTSIDGLIFQGGATRIFDFEPDENDSLGLHRWYGGALVAHAPSEVRHCIFRNNIGRQGAAICARSPYGGLTTFIIDDVTIESNFSLYGGAVSIFDSVLCEITDSRFVKNETQVFGSAVFAGSIECLISKSTFDENNSQVGGALFVSWDGSIYNTPNQSVKVTNSLFTNNKATHGGAICHAQLNSSTSLALEVENCTFVGNDALDKGGAVSIQVNSPDQGKDEILHHEVSIISSDFKDNWGNIGGAMQFETTDSMSVTIRESSFKGNRANWGGAVWINMVHSLFADVNLRQVEFDSNLAKSWGGLTVGMNSQVSYRIDSCLFINNMAEYYNSALDFWSNWQTPPQESARYGRVSNCDLIGNSTTEYGGALLLEGGTMELDNCRFVDNHSGGFAGAIEIWETNGAKIDNCLFRNNSGYINGAAIGVRDSGTVRCTNSLFSNNFGSSTIYTTDSLYLFNVTLDSNQFGLNFDPQYPGVLTMQNSILNNSDGNFSGAANDVISMGGNIVCDNSMQDLLKGSGDFADLHNTDPMLSELHVPMSGSPCIDAGNPHGLVSEYDLAGNPRIQGNGIDIGAYESLSVAVKDATWDSPDLVVFPNPLSNEIRFTLETSWTGPVHVSVYSPLGQRVLHKQVAKSYPVQTFVVDSRSLASGEYVLIVNTSDMSYAKKVAVVK